MSDTLTPDEPLEDIDEIDTGETPPHSPATRSLRDRVRALVTESDASEPDTAEKASHRRTPAEKAVARQERAGQRMHSVAPVFTLAYELAAPVVSRVDPPVGRLLEMQRYFAGDVWDEIVRGTIVQRALQPLVRSSKRLEALQALVEPIALVAAMERSEGAAVLLLPRLDAALEAMVIAGAPAMKKRAAQAAKAAEVLAESGISIPDLRDHIFAEAAASA